MNKIYRTVYNETTGTWVAVCETAKTHTKSASNSVVDNTPSHFSGSLKKGSLTAVAAALSMLSPFAAQQAQAADVLCKNNSTGVVSAKAACGTGESLVESLAVGSNAQVNSNHSFAIGNNAIVNTGSANSVALGSDSKVGPNANNSFAAVGGSAITNNTIAIGVRSIADGNGAIAFGSGINEGNNSGSYAKSEGSIAIGKRAEAVRADVTYSGKSGNYFLPQKKRTEIITLADGTEINHEYTYNRQLVNDGTANQMIAIGDNASAYGNQSIALGGNSVATGYAAISIGGDDIGHVENNHNAQGIQYLTGTLATELTNGGFTTPESINNLKNKNYFINLTTAKGAVSTAFGVKAVAEGDFSNAYGTAARSVGLNSNAIGTTSYAGGQESIAFGTAAYTNMQAEKATAIGYMSQIGKNGDNSVALGAKNKITQTNSAAIGQSNTVSVADTFVLGSGVTGDTTNSVYLGKGSTTATTIGGAGLTDVDDADVNGIIYSGFAGKKAQGIVSVGSDSSARRIQNVAAGKIDEDSTDAINGSQLHAVLPEYTTVGGDGADKDNAKSVTIGDKTYNFANYTAGDNITIDENGKISATGGSGENNWNLTVNDESSSATAPNAKRNLKDSDNIVINQTTDASDPTKADISFDLANVVTIGTPASKNPASGDKPVVIDGTANGGSITFTNADGTTSNQGVINGVASHLQDPASKDGQGKEINSANAPANFDSVKNEAATVGDVLNAGWNLQVADDTGKLQAADFVQHGDTVKFGDSTTIDAQYDAKDGVIKFNANTATPTVADGSDPSKPAGSATVANDDDKGKLVNAGDIVNIVNNTYWTATDGKNATPVKASDTVTFKGADKGNVTVTNNKGTFEFSVNTAGKAPTVTNIISTPAGDASEILTAGQVTSTINQVAQNWKWNIQGQNNGKNATDNAASVSYDETVVINAKDGLKLTQNGKTIDLTGLTISKSDPATTTGGNATATELTDADGNKYDIGGGSGENNWNLTVEGEDPSKGTAPGATVQRNLKNGDGNIDIQQDNAGNIYFDLEQSITVGHPQNGAPVTIDGNKGEIRFADNGGEIKFEGNNGIINGVASHFDNVGNATEMPANNAPNKWSSKTNQAATLGDVLNAGWGLKANGSAVDFVAHGDTVNFVSSDKSISIDSSVDKEGVNSQIDLSANVKFYSDDAGNTEANSSDKAKSVRVGNKLYQLGGDTYNVTGSSTPVTVVGTGSVKVEPDSVGADTYTVSIPVVANSGGNAATAANVANSSTGSVAVGENAKIDNNVADSIAIGKDASVGNLGTGNVVIGAGSSTPNRAENMVVIGTGLNITQGTPNTVVIGSGSAASSAADSDLIPNTFTFRSTSLNRANEGGVNDGAKATVATFNVGAEQGQLRQIKGVAAGRTEKGSTDAVNGDQLYTVALAVDNMGYSLAGGGTVDAQGNITGGTGVLGESFTVNTNDAYGTIGTIIGKNIAGTGEDTIEDAIKATKTIVEKESGSPITVSETKNGDKSTTYTVGIETTTPETVITDPTDSNVGKVVITSGDENKIVTAGDFATAINSSGWVASDSNNNAFVATGDTVTIQGKNGVKVELDAAKQAFTVESDYVFKDKDGNDVTSTGGDVTAIETTDDKGDTITYNIGGVDGNDITSLTAQGESANSTTGNLKLTDSGTGDSHQYDIALNNDVKLGDDKGNSGSLNVNNGTGGSTNIEGNKITFGDTTTPNSGSIDGLAQHFTKTGDTTAPSVATGTTDNQAATVGDVKNVGWNLKVGGQAKDFINHGDTVNFGDGKGTTAQFAKDATTGETTISFDIAKAGDSKVDTTVTNADAGKVTGGTGDEYWDSNQVQNAINNAGWKVGVGAKANDKDELINAGDRVGLVAGQGVSIEQNGSNFTIATDYVFKDGKGDDITSKGGNVATITTKNDKGKDVTYNFGDGNDNTVTAVTVNGGQDATSNAADGGNLKLEEKTDANGNPTYDIALNDEVDLTDKGSLKVGGDDIANGSSVTNITAGNIDFGDTQGSITNVASHLKDPASENDKGQVINPDNAPANFNSVKNEAATVGDVLNAGWNLKVGGQNADFVQHGDTVAFGNGTGTTAQYDATNGVISFDITKANNPIIPAVGKPNAGKVTGGTANQYWDSTQVQNAINNVGWFVNSGAVNGRGTNSGAASTLVNAGQEVKFIAGEGMNIVQNGKELTFNVKIKDNNNTPLKIDTDGYYVVNGGSGTGGGTGTGGGWTVVDPNNPNNFDINGGGQDVEFVGDVNTNVKVERPKQSGDPVGIQVGLNDTVYVGGTDDGTANGKPNAGSVTIDGTPNGNSITFNQDDPAHNVTVGTDGQGNLKVGDTNGASTKIVNVAPGENREDAVDVGQLVDTVGAANTTPATNSKGTQLNVVQTTTQPIDENGNPVGNPQEYTLKTYNVKDQGEYLTNNVVEAVSKMNEQGIKFFHTNEDENFVPVAQDHNSVDSSASGGLSTAIGVKAKANGKQAIVVGNESEANGVQSIAVGTQVVVNGDHSGGIGDPTIIDGSNSYSVGNMNSVSTNNTFVLGNEVTNTADNSVFLGDKSAANAKGAGATGTVNNATVGGISYSGFAGETSVGMVAVGNDTQVRRVSGVAAGEISATSTDAINGSQLHAVLPQYTVGSNGKVDNVTVGDKTYDFANYDFVGANGVDVNVDGASNTVTISGTPGYTSGVKAGENVTFNYEDNKDDAGNQLYVTNAGGATTNAADPDVKVDAAGNPVKQQTTVINANLKPVHNRIDQVQNQVQQVENNAYAGVAQAMATAGLPQAYLPGKSMVAIAGGHYKGEQGYAVGVSSISDSGNWVFKATASGNSRGSVGGTIGAGYQW